MDTMMMNRCDATEQTSAMVHWSALVHTSKRDREEAPPGCIKKDTHRITSIFNCSLTQLPFSIFIGEYVHDTLKDTIQEPLRGNPLWLLPDSKQIFYKILNPGEETAARI
jgi:hypothetical protein